jgi:hypothetical protein
MADPVSITGLVIAIGSVVQALLNYSLAAKEARKDIQSLTVELFALKGILDHIENQRQVETTDSASLVPGKFASGEFSQMLRSASEILKSLQDSLKPSQPNSATSIQPLKWPFKKEDVQKHIARLEKVKSWLVLIMTTDNL